VKLTDDIGQALSAAVPDGTLLYLDARLPPGLYQRVDAALRAAGGRWDKGKKAHAFPGPAARALEALRALEEVTTEAEYKQATQFFATPPDVVGDIISMAGLGPDHIVLEPSAGGGAIAAAAAPLAAAVDCIELDSRRAALLEQAGIYRRVRCGDFLAIALDRQYDRVLMNPPFTRGTDVRHVRHALRHVKPGGRLIAVMPENVRTRDDKAARALRGLIDSYCGWFEQIEDRAFHRAGTDVKTVIAVIQVPAAVQPPEGEPARVTTDHTSWGAPLFNAATARPGVYVRYDPWRLRDVVFRYAGACIGCGARTWAHDDGDDDRRGPFGDYTCMALNREDFPGTARLPDTAWFPRCAVCWDDHDRTRRARRQALASLRPAPAGPAAPEPAVAGVPRQLTLFGEDSP
jgi:predicted RNA methylase